VTRSPAAADVRTADPRAGTEAVIVEGDGIRFAGLAWGPTGFGSGSGRQAVLLHGIQNSAVTMARTARAMAADGWRCTALDMPGHGLTRWLDGAEDDARYERHNVVRLLAAAIAIVADRPTLVGHSWGADTALAIAASGADLERAVLIDPPSLRPIEFEALGALDVADLRPGDVLAARAVIAAAGLIRQPLDVAAKAEALTQASTRAILAAYRAAGAWQPEVDARRWLALPRRVPIDLIAGQPADGGLLPDIAVARLRLLLGTDRVHIMKGSGHSPQRTDFARFWLLLRTILA
jgi:pimeloyl-ACP methyl ester carboxylesterase